MQEYLTGGNKDSRARLFLVVPSERAQPENQGITVKKGRVGDVMDLSLGFFIFILRMFVLSICEVSIFGDTENPARHSPGQPT